MMWRTARDGLLTLPPPPRNLKAEVRWWSAEPIERKPTPSIATPKQRRAIAPPAPARGAATPEPLQLTSAPVHRAGAPELAELVERARPLMPMGRPALARELGITQHWARRVIDTLNAEQPGLRLVAGEDITP